MSYGFGPGATGASGGAEGTAHEGENAGAERGDGVPHSGGGGAGDTGWTSRPSVRGWCAVAQDTDLGATARLVDVVMRLVRVGAREVTAGQEADQTAECVGVLDRGRRGGRSFS